MNSCILMAQVVSAPELRSTQDQTSVTTMMVEFPSSREGEAPGQVQVEGWGKLAEEISSTYHAGDQIIIEGRLSMNLYDMPEGYKEKRAKVVASRVYPMGVASGYQAAPAMVDYAPAPAPQAAPAYSPAPVAAPAAPAANEDWDEIPF